MDHQPWVDAMYDLTKMLEEIIEDEKVSKSGNRKVSQREIEKLLVERRARGPQQEDLSQVPLGKILLKDGLITPEQLQEALELQAERGGRIGSLLVQLGYVQDGVLLEALSKKYDAESVSLLDIHISEDVLKLVPLRHIQEYRLLPVKVEGRNVHLAMETPNDFGAIHDVELSTGRKVHPMITTSYQMDLAVDYISEKGGGSFDGREIQQLLKGPMTIVSLLEALVGCNGSDLLVSVGSPPAIKKNGRLVQLDMPPTPKAIGEVYAKVLMTERQWDDFQEKKQITFISDHKSTGRLRVSVYRQRGCVSLSIRRVISGGLEPERLGLPSWLEGAAGKREGLIVIAGPSGHGKTTTAMALMDSINKSRCANIVAVHDCLEMAIVPRKSLINHRVMGADIHSLEHFPDSLFKQGADVLVLDEMRDAQGVEAALAAAASGCLVLGTILAPSAPSAVEKMIRQFPAPRHVEIRRRISECLLVVCCQKLVSGEADDAPRLVHERLGPRQPVRRTVPESGYPGPVEVRKSSMENSLMTQIPPEHPGVEREPRRTPGEMGLES